MNYAAWLETVPTEITNDPIWKLEVYRLALFIDNIGWPDVLALSKNNLMWSVADQLHRSLGSISANLTEGYSRSKGLDRACFFEYSLGSARESRDWYYKSRHVLSPEIVKAPYGAGHSHCEHVSANDFSLKIKRNSRGRGRIQFTTIRLLARLASAFPLKISFHFHLSKLTNTNI